MNYRALIATSIQAIVLTLFIFALLTLAQAQTRTSASYQLQSDSINFGGGLASSTSYSLESTAGEVATGESDSTNYSLKAGYQQMQSAFISMTAPGTVVLTPSIGGITGGVANGSTSVSVLTDSPSGYELSIVAESAPAMQKGVDTIADYVPVASPLPDFNFTTSATEAHFGFSPQGTDVVDRYLNNGSACSVSTNSTPGACWDAIGIADKQIALGGANQPSGATTTLYFRVGVGGSAFVLEGEYYATTTLTALAI